jgi:ABC-type dipeptide/oligopeptide/nickel transport system permease component
VENPQEPQIEAVRQELNLDEPRIVQYLAWLGRAARGDLSISFQSGRPVAEEIAKRFPATALLAVVALVFSIVLSVSAALIGAAFYDKSPDKIIRFLTQAGAAMPSFLLGLLVLQFVVVRFGWGKVVSGSSIADVFLPALCLAVGRASDWTQILRANLLEALDARYTIVARARGATRRRVLLRYALPNALIPFLTVVGVGSGLAFRRRGHHRNGFFVGRNRELRRRRNRRARLAGRAGIRRRRYFDLRRFKFTGGYDRGAR